MEEIKFRKGDIVEAFGVRGVVDHIYKDEVRVTIEGQYMNRSFHVDGRAAYWHKTPSLKLIERPKRKEKRTIERWVNIYTYGPGISYNSKQGALNSRSPNCIKKAVKLTGEYEVEVDEN